MRRNILYFRISAILFFCIVQFTSVISAQINDTVSNLFSVKSPIKIDRALNAPPVIPTADLYITGTVDNPTPTVGTNVIITLTAKNLGTQSNSGVRITYKLPPCYTFISSSMGAYNPLTSTFTWNIGNMAANATVTLTLTIRVNSYDGCISTAKITGTNSDSPLIYAYNNSVNIYIVPKPPTSTTDTDNDGILDVDDLDDDNDGILDDTEKYADQKTPPNGSWPIPTAPATPLFSKQLLFFDWSGVTLNNTNTSASPPPITHNGVTYTATVSSYSYSNTPTERETEFIKENMVGADINTWPTGNNAMIWRYYNISGNAFKEILNMPDNSSGEISLIIKVTAKKGSVEYPVDLVVFDPEATDGIERLIYTTNSGNFKLLEKTGSDPLNITGEGTNKITYIDTQHTSNQSNALYVTTGYSPTVIANINTYGNRSKEAFGFAIRLYGDADEDGIPNYLDTDSDNDGCADAIEGDEYVTVNLLKADKSINTAITGGIGSAVTDIGVPNIVNPGGTADVGSDIGQGIGDSQDKNINKACKNYWKGTKDTNWGDLKNWTNQYVPAINEDVEFATETNNPTAAGIAITGAAIHDLILDQNRIIGSLINATSYATILPASKALTVTGLVTGSETTPNKLQILAEKTLPNATFIVNPTLQNGTPLKVTVQMYARGDNLHPYSWKDIIIGSPTYGHIYTGSYRWQFFGIPVNSVDLIPTFQDSYVRKYSEPLNGTTYFQKWIGLTSGDKLDPFAGYEITQDLQKTITIQGDLVYGDKTITLTREAAGVYDPITNTTTRYGLGQNVLGNSFTAAIDIPKLNFPPKVEKTVYIYNTGTFGEWGNTVGGLPPTDATDAEGAYRAVPFFPSSIIWNEIPSMQGFVLYYTGAAETTAPPITMTLPYSGNAAIPNTKLQSVKREKASQTISNETIDFSYLKVELESNSTRDKLWLFNQPGTSAEFDDGWDGTKFFGTSTAYIYSPTPAGPMQINTNSNIIGTKINFIANYDPSYKLIIKKINLDTDYPVLNLVDLVNNTVVPLNNEVTSYTFTANSDGVDVPRFEIKGYIEPSGGTPTPVTYVKKDNVFITNTSSSPLRVLLFDIAGHLLEQSTVKPFENTQLKKGLQKGIYVIKITGENIDETKKIVIH